MKNLVFTLICFTLLFACKDDTSNNTKENNTNKVENTNTQKKEKEVTYIKKGTCDEFITGIDFSSFCFTSKQTPKYRLIQDGDNNCQYQIFDNNDYQNIDFSIAFADFNKPMKKGAEPNPEFSKQLFKTVFKKHISRRMLKTERDVPNLGDEAYIGYSEGKDEQVLGVRTGNVSFTFNMT